MHGVEPPGLENPAGHPKQFEAPVPLLKDPGGQVTQLEARGALYVPIVQFVQGDEPPEVYVPAVQFVQRVWPGFVENDPPGQVMHAETDEAPGLGENVPIGHCAQVPLPVREYVPA